MTIEKMTPEQIQFLLKKEKEIKKYMTLNQDDVKEFFNYNKNTGILTWKRADSNSINVGDEVGCTQNGYKIVSLKGKNYYVHRIIWLYVYGYFPENYIDHINRNKSDNRLCNLREISTTCSARNIGLFKNNKTGVKGVSWEKGRSKWRSQIAVNHKIKNLGFFIDFDEAVCTRLAVEQCLGWAGCDSNSSAFQYVQTHIIKTRLPYVSTAI